MNKVSYIIEVDGGLVLRFTKPTFKVLQQYLYLSSTNELEADRLLYESCIDGEEFSSVDSNIELFLSVRNDLVTMLIPEIDSISKELYSELSEDEGKDGLEKIGALIAFHFNINPHRLERDEFIRLWKQLKWILARQKQN